MKVRDRFALKRALLWPVLAFSTAAVTMNAQTAGQYPEADIAYGARLYAGQCTMCHGPNGDSVANVDLRSGKFRNSDAIARKRTGRGTVATRSAGSTKPP